MQEKWTDFEKLVINKLFSIEKRISKLEVRAARHGAMAGAVVAVIAAIIKAFSH